MAMHQIVYFAQKKNSWSYYIIVFSSYNQDVHVPAEYIFRELQVLPFYNRVHKKNGFMVYNMVNGLLPDIMSQLCMVKNEVRDHFTR